MVRRKPPHDPPTFDVCVHGQPISAQTSRRDLLAAWRQQVEIASRTVWSRSVLEGAIRLRVTYYCDASRIDPDNLRKPIQDALQGIVYRNDRQVRIGGDRILNINDPLKVRYMSPALALAFSDGRPFVHIEVWGDPDLESVL